MDDIEKIVECGRHPLVVVGDPEKSLRPAMDVYDNKTLRTSIIKINSNLRRAVRRFRCVPDASATRTGPDGSGNLLRPNEFPVVSGLRRIRIHPQTLLTRAWV